MAAHIVFILKRTHDRDKLVQYWTHARSAFAGHPIKMLAPFSPVEVLEGDDPVQATVIVEFTTREDAQAWYHSPAYAEWRDLRLQGADFLSILIDSNHPIPLQERLLHPPVAGTP